MGLILAYASICVAVAGVSLLMRFALVGFVNKMTKPTKRDFDELEEWMADQEEG